MFPTILAFDYVPYNSGFKSRQEVFEWMETAHINNVPVIRGWRGATAKDGDAFMEEWATRRDGEARVEIDKGSIRAHLLEQTNKKEEFEAWRADLEREAERLAKEKAKADAVKTEVTRRLEGCTLKGKAIKEEARRIRAEVEAAVSPVTVPSSRSP